MKILRTMSLNKKDSGETLITMTFSEGPSYWGEAFRYHLRLVTNEMSMADVASHLTDMLISLSTKILEDAHGKGTGTPCNVQPGVEGGSEHAATQDDQPHSEYEGDCTSIR